MKQIKLTEECYSKLEEALSFYVSCKEKSYKCDYSKVPKCELIDEFIYSLLCNYHFVYPVEDV